MDASNYTPTPPPTPLRRNKMLIAAAVAGTAVAVIAVAATVFVLASRADNESDSAIRADTTTTTAVSVNAESDADAAAIRAELEAIPGDPAAINEHLAGAGHPLEPFETDLAQLTGTPISCDTLMGALEQHSIDAIYDAAAAMPDPVLIEGYRGLHATAAVAAVDCQENPDTPVDPTELTNALAGIDARYEALGMR